MRRKSSFWDTLKSMNTAWVQCMLLVQGIETVKTTTKVEGGGGLTQIRGTPCAPMPNLHRHQQPCPPQNGDRLFLLVWGRKSKGSHLFISSAPHPVEDCAAKCCKLVVPDTNMPVYKMKLNRETVLLQKKNELMSAKTAGKLFQCAYPVKSRILLKHYLEQPTNLL